MPELSPAPKELFRFGFLCHRRDTAGKEGAIWRQIDRRWSRFEVGSFVVRTHPETQVDVRADGDCFTVLIGASFAVGVAPPLSHSDDTALFRALDHLTGRFALLMISGDRCRVFHDPFGARSVFYHVGGEFAVASHSALLAQFVGAQKNAEIAKFMTLDEYRNRTVRYLPGDRTVYDDIYALIPNNGYDSESRSTFRYWPREARTVIALDTFMVECDAYFAALTKFVKDRYFPVFGITAGIDSRTLLAAFRRFDTPFAGVTWTGSFLKDPEVPIIKQIVQHVNVEHSFLKPREGKEIGKIASWNIGFFRGDANLTEIMQSAFGQKQDATFFRGYGGEILRGFYNLRDVPMASASPEEMGKAYRSSLSKTSITAEYTKLVTASFELYGRHANYEGIDKFGFDINDLFYWEHRMGVWGSAMLNGGDTALYTFVGLNGRRLYKAAMSLPDEVRLSKEFLLKIVARYDPKLAKIPYL